VNGLLELASFGDGEEWRWARNLQLVLKADRFACANFIRQPGKTALRNAKPFALLVWDKIPLAEP
jgi:hypothetical protein